MTRQWPHKDRCLKPYFYANLLTEHGIFAETLVVVQPAHTNALQSGGLHQECHAAYNQNLLSLSDDVDDKQ